MGNEGCLGPEIEEQDLMSALSLILMTMISPQSPRGDSDCLFGSDWSLGGVFISLTALRIRLIASSVSLNAKGSQSIISASLYLSLGTHSGCIISLIYASNREKSSIPWFDRLVIIPLGSCPLYAIFFKLLYLAFTYSVWHLVYQ
ncbi:hypothetical protein GGR54DRAFT_580980 [Hypoxylon sp. NC1633]|nr:hypothetical protein GGR54DRAFT_580980 [Hypoxylon sp. NC1633]